MNTFKKEERLKSRSLIKEVFESGKGINVFPLKAVYKIYLHQPAGSKIQAGFSVSKKRFKRAVDRNLLKRRMREAYRANKEELKIFFNAQGSSCFIMFIFTGSELSEYSEIRDKIILTLQRIRKQNEQAT